MKMTLRAHLTDRAASAPLMLDANLIAESGELEITSRVAIETVAGADAAVPRFSGAIVDRTNRVGYVMVSGVVEPFGNPFYEMLGIPSANCERIERQLVALRDSELVESIVMVFHSPGGSTFGVEECAAVIREVNQVKPITAYVGYLCASAAYWLASQCSEIVASPSALIGSIGAYMMHVDVSEWYEDEGIRITYIARPDSKVEGNPAEPLSEKARENMQKIVDASYEAFKADILLTKPLDFTEKGEEYARVHVAAQAEALGLIDRVERFDTFTSKFGETGDTTSTRRARLDIMQRNPK